MRRATALVLWQAAPWVLGLLVVAGLVGTGLAAWSTWSAVRRPATVIVRGDGGVAGTVAVLVGLAAFFSWSRTVRTAVPVLVAGGITRRATTGGLLIGAVALAGLATGVLALTALAGGALQRAVAGSSPGSAVPSSGSDAYSSSLVIAHDAPANLFDPVEVLPWLVLASLGGVLVGAAWYRWRARGVLAVAVVAAAAWVASRVIFEAVLLVTPSRGVDALFASPLWTVGPCLVLALAVWLVLRRAPLRAPAR